MFNIVLVEPEIPANTGSIARTCLATGAHLHLVKPLGFSLDDRQLKRAGLDYWREVQVTLWEDVESFLQATAADLTRRFFLSTKATRPYFAQSFQRSDWLIFGRETKGLPEPLLHAQHEQSLTIPMTNQTRSLNLAVSVGVVLFEAIRQIGKDG